MVFRESCTEEKLTHHSALSGGSMAEKRTFEQSMGELEQVVRKLESQDLSLDESLANFEKGIALIRECEVRLSEAKGKVEKLIKDASNGLKPVPFEPQG
jgi:exodeoxyribonuclease VII small subunit